MFFYHWVNGAAVSKWDENEVAIFTHKSDVHDMKYSLQIFDWKAPLPEGKDFGWTSKEYFFDDESQKLLQGNYYGKILEYSA